MALTEAKPVKPTRHNLGLTNKETTRLIKAVSWINLQAGRFETDKSSFIYDAVMDKIEKVEKEMKAIKMN